MPTRDSETDLGSPLTVEVGREFATACQECGRSQTSTTGFVYRGGDAFAIYHSTLHDRDGVRRADIGIGIGDWASDDSVADVSAFLAVWPDRDEMRFGFVDPDRSTWANAELLGHQLTAAEARESPSRPELLRVAEAIVNEDEAVARHLRHG